MEESRNGKDGALRLRLFYCSSLIQIKFLCLLLGRDQSFFCLTKVLIFHVIQRICAGVKQLVVQNLIVHSHHLIIVIILTIMTFVNLHIIGVR